MKTRLILSLLAILLILFGMIESHARAQEAATSPLANQTWVRLGGPPGGLEYDIRMRPDNPDIMYVTDAFSGVYISTDGGQTWFPTNEGINARRGPSGDAIPIFSLTIDPNNPDTIWAGSQEFPGIYRSTDGGQSWEKRVNDIVEEQGISFRGFSIEPGNSDVVYAAGEIGSWIWAGRTMWGIGFDRTAGVVYKSTDSGLHWRAIWRGDNLARYVLIDPTNVNVLYVSTGIFDREAANSDPLTRTPGGVGILKSTDGGETWSQINEGLENQYIGSLAMHPENPQILLAAAGNVSYLAGSGVYLTNDGGAHWQKVITAVEGGFFTAVDFAPGNQVIYYAAGGHVPFYSSQDNGVSWQKTTLGERGWRPPGFRVSLPIDMQVDPRDPLRIFVNNYGGGNYYSEDGGSTWTSASTGYSGAEIWDVSIHPDNPAIVYANGRSGPFVSYDGGKTWLGINPDVEGIQDGPQIAIDPHDPTHLIASEAQFGFTFESHTGGSDWQFVLNLHEAQPSSRVPTGQQSGLHTIIFAPSNPRIVYGGLSTWNCSLNPDANMCNYPALFSVITSTDGGSTWIMQEALALKGLSILDIAVHPTDPNIAWAATGGGGIFRTTDGGVTWEQTSDGLWAKIVTSLAIVPSHPSVIYAGTATHAVFKSENGGLSWRQISGGMDPNEHVRTIVVDPTHPNVVYAGSRISGVFFSEDGGVTWQRIDDGLRTRSVRALAISSDGMTLYAATNGEGIFRLSTHDQSYFNSLAPTPTPIPPTATPTQIITSTMQPSSTPQPESTSQPSERFSGWLIPLAASVLILVAVLVLALLKRKK